MTEFDDLKGKPIIYKGIEFSPLLAEDLDIIVEIMPNMQALSMVFDNTVKVPAEDKEWIREDTKEASKSLKRLVERVIRRTFPFNEYYEEKYGKDKKVSKQDAKIIWETELSQISFSNGVGLIGAILSSIGEATNEEGGSEDPPQSSQMQ